MKTGARIDQLETLINERASKPEHVPYDWEAQGELGVLTRDCLTEFIAAPEDVLSVGFRHQLMMVGTFALAHLSATRPVLDHDRRQVKGLMTDPEYYGIGQGEKHPNALRLYRLCAARGWFDD